MVKMNLAIMLQMAFILSSLKIKLVEKKIIKLAILR